MFPTVAGMTGIYHHAQLFSTGTRCHKLFVWLALNGDHPDLSLPSSQDYRHKLPVPGFYVLFFFFNESITAPTKLICYFKKKSLSSTQKMDKRNEFTFC
jgi:hypothetical protein